ncbi:MAG: MarR family transcriptional regulator [Hydrogenophaga sp.]|jgi:DNA-binding MarR family transcriptional regulator|uniref:MarR family winged helix-turn-helix transcriptional regulator n=1 Tax=Hydrogenophaga sp. TaxID=1904254 RepID=UPI001DD42AE7|nr:MarR family transcriptional regulator [Hydrogenophaga sp.]MBW0172361.1 MarR family transcriptional regulator [Hydrogenophaga sp.]MBW0182732.1 MarR family transcriptional regulator [Hydrogenophaga sp.]
MTASPRQRRSAAATEPAPNPEATLGLHEPGHLFRRAHQHSVSCFNAVFGRAVTPLQYAALRVLQEHPGIDQVTLAAAIALDTSTTAEIAVRLERDGWIVRELGARRQRRLELTAEGQRVLQDMLRSEAVLADRILQTLEPTEREVLMALMHKLLGQPPG